MFGTSLTGRSHFELALFADVKPVINSVKNPHRAPVILAAHHR
jgi:hypothetical protein